MYLVLYNSNNYGPILPDADDINPLGQEPMLGPFKTIAEAEQEIINEAKASWEAADDSRYEEPEKYASRTIIVKVVKAVRPVPSVNVDWKMKKAEDMPALERNPYA